MSYTVDDWRAAIVKMIQKTSKKELHWMIMDSHKLDVWTEVDRSYQCEMNGKLYVISLTRKKYYLDEEEFVWQNGYDFSIFASINGNTVRIASAPETLSIIEQLFKAAEDSYAYASDALKDLL